MAEQEIAGFENVKMPAERAPKDERGDRRDKGNQPSRGYGQHLGADQRRNAVGQLDEQAQRAGFLFTAEGANSDKWKQQRHRKVEGAERRHEHPVEGESPPASAGASRAAVLASP